MEKYVFDLALQPNSVFSPPTELALRYRGELQKEEKLWIAPSRIAPNSRIKFMSKVPKALGSIDFASLALRGANAITKLDVEEVRCCMLVVVS